MSRNHRIEYGAIVTAPERGKEFGFFAHLRPKSKNALVHFRVMWTTPFPFIRNLRISIMSLQINIKYVLIKVLSF